MHGLALGAAPSIAPATEACILAPPTSASLLTQHSSLTFVLSGPGRLHGLLLIPDFCILYPGLSRSHLGSVTALLTLTTVPLCSPEKSKGNTQASLRGGHGPMRLSFSASSSLPLLPCPSEHCNLAAHTSF